MIITRDFKFVFYRLLIVGVLIQITNLFFWGVYNWNEDRWIFDLLQIAPSFLLWLAIGYITKNQQRALICFFIQKVLVIIGVFYVGLYNIPYSSTIIHFIAPITAFSFFGYDYFKNHNGLWLGVFGVSVNISSSLGWFWDKIFSLFGFGDLFSFHGETIVLNYLDLIFNSFSLIIQFGLFWIVLNYMKSFKSHNYDFSFRKLIPFSINDKVTFSIVFWLFRIAIASVLFNGFSVFNISNSFYEQNFDSLMIYRLILSLMLTIYIISSLYRNFMVDYFIQRNHYPSWFYYVLNIPVLNLIAWSIFMLQKNEKTNIESNNVLDKIEEANDTKQTFKGLKIQFVDKGKSNRGIKTLIFCLITVNFLSLLVSRMDYNIGEILMQVGILYSIALAFIIFYFESPNGVIFVLGAYFIGIFIYIFFEYKGLEDIMSYIYSISSLIVYYPLFHFDQFSFVENEEVIQSDLSEE